MQRFYVGSALSFKEANKMSQKLFPHQKVPGKKEEKETAPDLSIIMTGLLILCNKYLFIILFPPDFLTSMLQIKLFKTEDLFRGSMQQCRQISDKTKKCGVRSRSTMLAY